MRARKLRCCAVLAAALSWPGFESFHQGGLRAADEAPSGAEEQERIARGRELFTRVWRPLDPRCRDDDFASPRFGDGLGPVFNDTSCVACHSLGGVGGAGPAEKNVQILVLRKKHGTVAGSQLHPGLSLEGSSTVLHRSSVLPSYAKWRQTRLDLANTACEPQLVVKMLLADLPRNSAERKAVGKITDDLTRELLLQNQRSIKFEDVSFSEAPLFLTERNPPALFGASLIYSIGDQVIEEAAQTQRRQSPQIAGRAVRTVDGRVGRFGWQAQQATLSGFTLTACAVELGLSVPGHPQASEPQSPTERVSGLDMSSADCGDLLAFMTSLPPPQQHVARADSEMVASGKKLFDSVGCADCHLPKLGYLDGMYSDLLVHKMGVQLAGPSASSSGAYSAFVASPGGLASQGRQAANLENEEQGIVRTPATAFECRTPPLWGVASSAPYLHDGRAATLRDAILMHAGQGAAAASAFQKLNEEQRQHLLIFLNSLVAPRPAGPVGSGVASSQRPSKSAKSRKKLIAVSTAPQQQGD